MSKVFTRRGVVAAPLVAALIDRSAAAQSSYKAFAEATAAAIGTTDRQGRPHILFSVNVSAEAMRNHFPAVTVELAPAVPMDTSRKDSEKVIRAAVARACCKEFKRKHGLVFAPQEIRVWVIWQPW